MCEELTIVSLTPHGGPREGPLHCVPRIPSYRRSVAQLGAPHSSGGLQPVNEGVAALSPAYPQIYMIARFEQTKAVRPVCRAAAAAASKPAP